jgi:hypothetical protein
MNRNGVLARTLITAGLAFALGTSAAACAQESDSAADAPAAADQSAAPSDEPRRRRDRRRDAESAAAAPAAPTVTELPQTTVLAETVETKITCRNIKPPGSRVARRICGTEQQWAAANQRSSEDAEEGLRQFRNRSGVTGTPASGPASLNAPAGL